jgi:hypothetical protein
MQEAAPIHQSGINISEDCLSLLADQALSAIVEETLTAGAIPAPFFFAGVPDFMPNAEGIIEISPDQLGVGVYTTIGNVLRAHNISVADVHWWSVFCFMKDGRAVYTLNKHILPVDGYELAGFAFTTNEALRAFWHHSNDVNRWNYLKLRPYLSVMVANYVNLIENCANCNLVTVTLAHDGFVIGGNKPIVASNAEVENAIRMTIEEHWEDLELVAA